MVEIHTKLCFGHFYSLEYQSIANTKVQSKQTKPPKKVKERKRHLNN